MFKKQKLKPLIEDIQFCSNYIKNTKSLRLSFYTVAIYVLFVILCFLFVPFIIPLEKTVIANDFRIFYQSAQNILSDPTTLYTSPVYNMPFRYLPLFSLLFIPYTFIPFEVGFIIHVFLMTIVHIASFYLVLIISLKWFNISFNSKIKRDMLYLSLMAPLQVVLLLIGQITNIFILMYLVIILLVENEKNRRYKIRYAYFLVGLLAGLSISYKPFAFLLLPFLLTIFFDISKRRLYIGGKQILSASIGFITSFSINLVYWILYPNLIPDFIEINNSSQLLDYPSTSITRILSVIFNAFSIQLSEFTILVGLTLILFSLAFFIYILNPIQLKNYSLFLGMGILITMITFPDSWFLNFLICFMLILPGLLKLEDELNVVVSEKERKTINQTFYIIYKISQYGILFFTVGIVLSMTILTFDPILPFLLIILYIIISWRLLLYIRKKKSLKSKTYLGKDRIN